jgi:predicted metal-binding protein
MEALEKIKIEYSKYNINSYIGLKMAFGICSYKCNGNNCPLHSPTITDCDLNLYEYIEARYEEEND